MSAFRPGCEIVKKRGRVFFLSNESMACDYKEPYEMPITTHFPENHAVDLICNCKKKKTKKIRWLSYSWWVLPIIDFLI